MTKPQQTKPSPQGTKPPSGFRDFLPADVRQRRHVVRVVEEVYESHGFEPLETPAVENLDTLLGKYGEEGDQLIFRLMHRREKLERALAGEARPSERELGDEGLRYDLTVPLARVVGRFRGELPRVWRRYQVQPVWRADRPGKGRFREFYQCDVDVIGTASALADVEVCHAVSEVLERLGFADFRILLNHRQLLRSMIAAAGVPEALEGSALVGLDKLDKVGADGVREELCGRGVSAEAAAALLARAAPPGSADSADAGAKDAAGLLAVNDARLAAAAEGLDARGQAAVAELRKLAEVAAGGPAGRHLAFAPALARGLGYYTGAIFEVAVADLAGSLGGGGRYDGLVGMFSGTDIPAVGFSLGLERILVVMEERGLFPAHLASGPDVVVCGFPDVGLAALLDVAARLRKRGFARVQVFPEPEKKLGQQLKHAGEVKARFAAIVGQRELERGVVALKDLASGEQREEPLA